MQPRCAICGGRFVSSSLFRSEHCFLTQQFVSLIGSIMLAVALRYAAFLFLVFCTLMCFGGKLATSPARYGVLCCWILVLLQLFPFHGTAAQSPSHTPAEDEAHEVSRHCRSQGPVEVQTRGRMHNHHFVLERHD